MVEKIKEKKRGLKEGEGLSTEAKLMDGGMRK